MIKKPNLDYIIYGVIGIVLGAILTLAGTNIVYGQYVGLEFTAWAYIGFFLVLIGVSFVILAFFKPLKP
jgi:heme/copper-type cytochrome/quinol oxidase subunit 4